MSLDCVEISLGRVFASGQAYVALSRARSLQGLRVLDFDPTVVRCDSRVLHFYATLRQGRGLSLVRSQLKVDLLGVGRLGQREDLVGRPPRAANLSPSGWRQKERGVGPPQAVALGMGTSQ